MWRFVLPGAGVVGMTLLVLAGSLASWSFGGGAPPTSQTAPAVAPSAVPAEEKPAPVASAPKQPAAAAVGSEEDAMRLALAALASVPSASAPNVQADAAIPPPASAPSAMTAAPSSPSPAPLPPAASPAPTMPAAAASVPPSAPLPPAAPPPSMASDALSPPLPEPRSPVAPPFASPSPAAVPASSKQAEQPTTPAPMPEAAASPYDAPERGSFASVESLVHRLRAAHRRDSARAPSPASAPAYTAPPGDRLAIARALLASGEPDRARPLLEEAAAQLVLRSDDATMPGSPAAARVDDALRWLSAGQPARALGLVDAAIAALDQGRGYSSIPADRRFATRMPASGPDSGLW
jgi:hypothetical protein